MLRKIRRTRPPLDPTKFFGVPDEEQLDSELREMAAKMLRLGPESNFSLSSAALLRPGLALPAYAGLAPADGSAPIFNLFDRVAGGLRFRYTVTRKRCRDFRGGRLTYDEHDGTDFVCPPGTPVVAAAPGVLVATRARFKRGGLTAMVDHGGGVVTQYTHLHRVLVDPGHRLRRGEKFALSGATGMDMLFGFPWVPPHVHFMVWVRGQPVDPFIATGESPRPGCWVHGNTPRTSDPLPEDGDPPSLEDLCVDERALETLVPLCLDKSIRDEIDAASSLGAKAAICEDSLHHDRESWTPHTTSSGLRAWDCGEEVRLTLPLSSSLYRVARMSDSWWTRWLERRRAG